MDECALEPYHPPNRCQRLPRYPPGCPDRGYPLGYFAGGPWDTLLAERAVRLFESRPDKDWSLTDCLSFMVMAERQLPKALTSDRHFVQAGFEALLLADPS
jgi:hypothetical protein